MNEENNPKQTQEEDKPVELTEKDLEQVAGGAPTVFSRVNQQEFQKTK